MSRIAYYLHAGISAVNRQGDSRYVGRVGGGEENDRCVQLSLVSVALQGNHCFGILLEEFAVQGFFCQRCVEIAGADSVDGDAVDAPFCCQGSGQVDNAAFGCVVGS